MAGRISRLILLACAGALLTTACGKRDGASGKAAPLPSGGRLAVEARLEEVPGSFPANDLYDYVYIMKYRVTKVLRGTLEDSILLVGHYNPRVSRAEVKGGMDSLVDGDVTTFTPGDVHRLVLVDLDSAWTQAVEDGYFRDTRKRYFARWVSK